MDNANKNRINLALYIVLALIVAAVVCMTVIGIVNSSKKANELPPMTDAPSGTTSRPEQQTNKPSETTRLPETNGNMGDDEDDDDGEDDDDVGATPDEPSQDVDAPVVLKFTEPVEGYLLKGYDIDLPVYSLTMNDYRVHAGLDILADPGAPVCAVAEGTVQNIYDDPLMGKCISVSHTSGLVSYYMGLSDEIYEGIVEGAPVYCGQPLSSVGDSTLIELAEESHLHFEMKLNGDYVDPSKYVSYEKTTSAGVVDDNYEG